MSCIQMVESYAFLWNEGVKIDKVVYLMQQQYISDATTITIV